MVGLRLLMPDFEIRMANIGRSIGEGRLRLLQAVLRAVEPQHHETALLRVASGCGSGVGVSPMHGGVRQEQARPMPSTCFPTPPLLYVESDLAEGQTLGEWRRARRAPRAPHGRVHRVLVDRFARRAGPAGRTARARQRRSS